MSVRGFLLTFILVDWFLAILLNVEPLYFSLPFFLDDLDHVAFVFGLEFR